MTAKTSSSTDAELKAALGAAMALWSGIVQAAEDVASPLTIEWKPSKAEFGRICLLRHKKRTLLYLAPERDSVTVAIVFGERAYGLAMASSLPASIKTLFSEARPYAEGRGIRFSAVSPSDIATIRTLLEIKTAPNAMVRESLSPRKIMKGGKQGRQRRVAGSGVTGKAGSRGTAKPGGAKRPGSVAPKKGERVKTFGGRSSREG
jgi:hypothetical protein